MKQLRQRLTYANVMSTIAVFVAFGGATAFAAQKMIGSHQLKAGSVRTGKLHTEAVTAGKIRKEAVATGKLRNDAVTGAKAAESTFSTVPAAVVAETAAPRAYTRVINHKTGLAVDPVRSKNVATDDITFVGTSVYCFELGFVVRNVQATVDWINGGANTFAQASVEPFSACPAGTDASVRTTDIRGDGVENINFYVAFVG
ncbi:MAG TPA: hypothetical protein VMS60_03930 [Solirubrobacterales bacterium]|nr:hypothetical protein [Solirubrobacterales bacterium]